MLYCSPIFLEYVFKRFRRTQIISSAAFDTSYVQNIRKK